MDLGKRNHLKNGILERTEFFKNEQIAAAHSMSGAAGVPVQE